MRSLIIALRFLLILTILTGAIYPLAVTGLAQILFPFKAAGSLINASNEIVGSELIAQNFSTAKYFWVRPSAVKYDGNGSGATNQSVASADIVKTVKARESQGLVADLRFSSASGLDPEISPEAANSQVERVAVARNLNPEQRQQLDQLLSQSVSQRQLGVLGEPRVNVLRLNRLIDQSFGKPLERKSEPR